MCDMSRQLLPNLVLAYHISDKSLGLCVCTDEGDRRELKHSILLITHDVFTCKLELFGALVTLKLKMIETQRR